MIFYIVNGARSGQLYRGPEILCTVLIVDQRRRNHNNFVGLSKKLPLFVKQLATPNNTTMSANKKLKRRNAILLRM